MSVGKRAWSPTLGMGILPERADAPLPSAEPRREAAASQGRAGRVASVGALRHNGRRAIRVQDR